MAQSVFPHLHICKWASRVYNSSKYGRTLISSACFFNVCMWACIHMFVGTKILVPTSSKVFLRLSFVLLSAPTTDKLQLSDSALCYKSVILDDDDHGWLIIQHVVHVMVQRCYVTNEKWMQCWASLTPPPFSLYYRQYVYWNVWKHKLKQSKRKKKEKENSDAVISQMLSR